MTELLPWMCTSTGIRFWYNAFKPEDFNLTDIAHALSNICRFTGHSRVFYSVAQHSVLVSRLCEPKNKVAGLLHDAAEAYIGDINHPLKSYLDGIKKLERQIAEAIFLQFGIKYWDRLDVFRADKIMLATENRDLMPTSDGWYLPEPPMEAKIEPLMPVEAEALFWEEYAVLGGRQDE